MDESLWTSDMALIFFGVCHSLIYPHKISADHRDVVNSSTFYLDPSINYRIFIHDPKFYLLLSKNGIFPRIFLQYKSGQNLEAGQFDYYEISVTPRFRWKVMARATDRAGQPHQLIRALLLDRHGHDCRLDCHVPP